MTNSPKVNSGFFQVLSSSTYLACSWAWCIGMFVPVFLIREFGNWSWVIFAVPNILGAAAFGFVLRKQGSSEEFVSAHKSACIIFSAVTIAFQSYFLGWIRLVFEPLHFLAAIGLGVLFFCFIFFKSRARFVSVVLYGLSLAVGIGVIAYFFEAPHDYYRIVTNLPDMNIIFLAPVFFFGFLFSPYLDLTFHKARQVNSEKSGMAAFALGFGILFTLVLMFTLFYAKPMSAVFYSAASSKAPIIFISCVLAYMTLQALFTISVHLREMNVQVPLLFKTSVIPFILLCLGLFVLPTLIGAQRELFGIDAREIVFRSFMVFYGLIAPAYIWLFAMSNTPGTVLNRKNLLIFTAVILIALPVYAIAFLGSRSGGLALLLPAIIMVLSSRFFICKS